MKKNPHEHKCQITRRSGKVKAASKFWVADKVKDWLLVNQKIIAMELQRRLQDQYKVLIPYKRVWYGKELALEQMLGIGGEVLITCIGSRQK